MEAKRVDVLEKSKQPVTAYVYSHTIKRLDRMVYDGRFRTRSQAIEHMILKGMVADDNDREAEKKP